MSNPGRRAVEPSAATQLVALSCGHSLMFVRIAVVGALKHLRGDDCRALHEERPLKAAYTDAQVVEFGGGWRRQCVVEEERGRTTSQEFGHILSKNDSPLRSLIGLSGSFKWGCEHHPEPHF